MEQRAVQLERGCEQNAADTEAYIRNRAQMVLERNSQIERSSKWSRAHFRLGRGCQYSSLCEKSAIGTGAHFVDGAHLRLEHNADHTEARFS